MRTAHRSLCNSCLIICCIAMLTSYLQGILHTNFKFELKVKRLPSKVIYVSGLLRSNFVYVIVYRSG